MAKLYRVTPMVRLFNGLTKMLVRFGRGPQQTHILTVRGRKSGKLRSTPVSLVTKGANRWLVSPYGQVNWVRNARAADQVSLRRGQDNEDVSLIELEPQDSAPVLKMYVQQESFPRPYFEAGPEAPVETFEADAANHPVFLIVAATNPSQ